MCACGEAEEDTVLYDTVQAVAAELCPRLGVSIPVGKDSLSMRTIWKTSDGREVKMTAPLSLVVSAFSPVLDVRKTVTPDLKPLPSSLILLDLGRGRNRPGGSSLARVYNRVGGDVPDLDEPETFVAFFNAIQRLIAAGLLKAYHDRSDGGLFVTLAEMAFGGRIGMQVHLDELGDDPLRVLFAEELGAVMQVAESDLPAARRILGEAGLSPIAHEIAHLGEEPPSGRRKLEFFMGGRLVYRGSVTVLNRLWSELTYRMQTLRDNPECAREEYDNLLNETDPGMQFVLTFDPTDKQYAPPRINSRRPKVAILREQGVNGHVEMAAAFDRAGFESVDVHMTDLLSGLVALDDFEGLVACGGFSYGDVLGAGSGWAKCSQYNEQLRAMFARFFNRSTTFALGVCNGCQMLSQLKAIIPGAEDWPAFTRNKSEQFEARFVTVEILNSPSVLLAGMAESRLGIPVAHGEGRADFSQTGSLKDVLAKNLVSMRYVDNYGRPTERYPFNPNGSPAGITGLTTPDGRITIMMPHPERAFRCVQMAYWPRGMFEGEEGPWLRLFQNARRFVS